MTRRMRQLASAVCALSVLMTSMTAFAADTPSDSASDSTIATAESLTADQVLQIALLQIDETDSVEYSTAQMLYNLADNPVAYMYYLKPQGYIIADDQGRILEYNLEGDHLFFTDAEQHYYYGGVMSYMVRDGEEIVDLLSGDALSTETTAAASDSDAESFDTDYSSDSFWREDSLELSRESQVSTTGSSVREDLDHATRMYNCNVRANYNYFGVSSGVCGSTALAIMTAYLDDYHTDSTHNWCLDTKKTSNSSSSNKYGRELVKELVGYVEPSGKGSFVLGGYTYYLQAHDIWDRKLVVAVTENGSWNSARSSIQRDYPCVVGVSAGFTGVYESYNESHYMTVVSVSKTSSGTKYYHVNCGWGTENRNHNGYDKLNANGTNIGRVYYLADC